MTRRLLPPLAALFTLAALIAPETRATDEVRGWASAYAPGRMEEVIRTRFDNDWWPNPPPRGWYESAGAIAVMDCATVGQMATVIDQGGREYPVLIADCAGADGPPDRFSKDNIIMELDAELWRRFVDEYGRPVSVGLR